MVAFGRPYIANPDLVERLATGAPLAEVDWETVYASCARDRRLAAKIPSVLFSSIRRSVSRRRAARLSGKLEKVALGKYLPTRPGVG
jgi:2,4-dienoyl-CoA reductase-like NADH-dependent reductase (Old Yellow Enzyme family)